MARSWLLVIYTVPTRPTRTRWRVWRDLRRLGAVLLRDGVAALPATAATQREAQQLARGITDGGGTATIARATFDAAAERHTAGLFVADREREYAEISESCDSLLEHIEREADHARFTFAELQELEADLNKIRRWAVEATARDHIGNATSAAVDRRIALCERRLAQFAERAGREEERGATGRPVRKRRR